MMYEDMIRETEEMIRGVMLREQIAEWALIGICTVLAAFLVMMWVTERREAKKTRCAFLGEYRPTVTDDVQTVNGVEFRRMGPVGRRCE